MANSVKTLDGNEAAASIAYRTNEICAIYPITPSSTMAELADQWATEGKTNIWGTVPHVIEMQSEGGVAGAVHGALQTGALTTTFTASQGLLLMIPNMFKIAGELTPTVFHVAARALATQALSIFGDHSDVMAARMTGWALLCSSSVQEAHDLALIAQNATLASRIPFVHFFDGFRTSHEVSKIEVLSDDDVRAMIDDDLVFAHRARALDPDRPVVRGVAQDPNVYFQGRETANPFYAAVPSIVQAAMDRFATLTGRQYRPFEYFGATDAEHVIVLMGSGVETVRETIELPEWPRGEAGRRAGPPVPAVFGESSAGRRPPLRTGDRGARSNQGTGCARRAPLSGRDHRFCRGHERQAPPRHAEYRRRALRPRVERVHAGDGEGGVRQSRVRLTEEPLHDRYQRRCLEDQPRVRPRLHHRGGRRCRLYFLRSRCRRHSGGEQELDQDHRRADPGLRAGLLRVRLEEIRLAHHVAPPLRAQADPIDVLVQRARFIACHQFPFVERVDMLDEATDGAVFLLNSPFAPGDVWDELPRTMQEALVRKHIRLYVIDADRVAIDAGMPGRINTIMQTCFFAISGVLPRDEAIARIKDAIETTYARKGKELVEANFAAVDRTLENLHEVVLPPEATSTRDPAPLVPAHAPEFVRQVTAMMIAGRGDELPVSALPVDGTYPPATARWEKRNVSDMVPVWEPELCIQCGNCAMVCPHATIRARYYDDPWLANAPEGFASAPLAGRGFPNLRYTLQVAVEDCTGCELCVEACPVRSLEAAGTRAINMGAKAPILERERKNLAFFDTLPDNKPAGLDGELVRGAQYLTPLFEFSGACAGCGETPYLRLLTQLFGDRLLVANATGCSSIYGGNLPTTPWSVNREGRGPAWSNSLFEDNAEFGLGFRLSLDKHREEAEQLLARLAPQLGQALVREVLDARQVTQEEVDAQRDRVAALEQTLDALNDSTSKRLRTITKHLVRKSVWIVGGDGWAYDIGYGGLDHVLASGRNVNILVLDTEVYSNTGGQASKATPRGGVAKFAAGGKQGRKKDLGLMAVAYGNVYVAQIAMGASSQQTMDAFLEAEAHDGPSLIIAYSHCIAHGINMRYGMRQQKLAVECGHWPLYRFKPATAGRDRQEFVLDSQPPSIPLKTYAYNEIRYKMLSYTKPDEARRLLGLAQEDIHQRWRVYSNLADRWPATARRGQGESGSHVPAPAAAYVKEIPKP